MVICVCKKGVRRVAEAIASIVSKHDLFEKKGERKRQPELPVEPKAN